MEEIVKDAMEEYAQHEAKGMYPVYRAPWSLVGNVDALTTIVKEDPAHPTPSRARIFGRINGNYRHFIDFFYAETARQLFEWNKFMFGYVVDTQVLANIHTASSSKPHMYMGVKWTCLQPSSLVHRRDNVYLEYLTHTKDAKGRDIGVRVTLPLDIPACPSLEKRFKTKRIRLYTVWISRAVPNEPFVTDFFMLSENDFNGLKVTSSYYKKMMNILKDMAVFVDSRRILVQGMVTRNEWVPSDSRRNCKLCSRKFHAARRRHHCRLCGEVICRRCVIVRDAPKGGPAAIEKTFSVVKTKFCMLCVTKMREADSTVIEPNFAGSNVSSNATDSAPVQPVENPESSSTVASDADADAEVVEAPSRSANSRLSYVHGDWEYDSRSSTWSETESEEGKMSLYSNSELDDERSSVSAMSESSMDKMSFMTTLEAIQDEPTTDKSSASASASASATDLGDFTKDIPQPHNSVDFNLTADVAETIDTTDMMPVSRLSQRSTSRMSSVSSAGRTSATAFATTDDRDFDFEFFPSHRKSMMSSGSLPPSPRSIDKSLAEQEELLRMMLAASGREYSRPASVSGAVPGASPPASSPPVAHSGISRPKVKLYEQ